MLKMIGIIFLLSTLSIAKGRTKVPGDMSLEHLRSGGEIELGGLVLEKKGYRGVFKSLPSYQHEKTFVRTQDSTNTFIACKVVSKSDTKAPRFVVTSKGMRDIREISVKKKDLSYIRKHFPGFEKQNFFRSTRNPKIKVVKVVTGGNEPTLTCFLASPNSLGTIHWSTIRDTLPITMYMPEDQLVIQSDSSTPIPRETIKKKQSVRAI